MRLRRKPIGKEEEDERVKDIEIVEEELAFLVTIFYGKKLLCIDDIHFQGSFRVGIQGNLLSLGSFGGKPFKKISKASITSWTQS